MAGTDQTETKVCKMCAETIKAAAVVCPHCRRVQTTWKIINPNLTAMATLITIGIYVFAGFLLISKIVGQRNFEPYKSQITILESTVSQRDISNSNGVFVVITGTLTNGSDYSWKRMSIEGQLFGTDGRLIDAIPSKSDAFNDDAVVAAHSVAAFKIESRTSHALADYANHKVNVQWAVDATSWP